MRQQEAPCAPHRCSLPFFLSWGHLFTAVLEVFLFVLDNGVVPITAGYRGLVLTAEWEVFLSFLLFLLFQLSSVQVNGFQWRNTGRQSIESMFHDGFQFLLLLSAPSIHPHPWKCALVKGKRYGNITSYVIFPWYPATFLP